MYNGKNIYLVTRYQVLLAGHPLHFLSSNLRTRYQVLLYLRLHQPEHEIKVFMVLYTVPQFIQLQYSTAILSSTTGTMYCSSTLLELHTISVKHIDIYIFYI